MRKIPYLGVIIVAFLVLNLWWMHSLNHELALMRLDISAIPGKTKIEKHVTRYPSADRIAKRIRPANDFLALGKGEAMFALVL